MRKAVKSVYITGIRYLPESKEFILKTLYAPLFKGGVFRAFFIVKICKILTVGIDKERF